MERISILFFLLAVIGASFGNTTPKKRTFVGNVKQNYNITINELLEKQIVRELEASYIYQAYASYFQRADVNLPGIQKFFAESSAEEKQHAQMLIEYVNKRGGHVIFDNIELINTCTTVKKNKAKYYVNGNTKTRMCICSFIWTLDVLETCPPQSEWKNGLYAFEDALAVERYVNSELLKIHKQADDLNDAHLAHFLEHDFLSEQVDAINQLGHFVTRLRSFKGDSYALGEYLFDQKMK